MARIKRIATELQVKDKLLDYSGDAGTSGQLLSSTGTGTNWITFSGVTASNGANTRVAFFTGSNTIEGSTGLYWNNSDNKLGIGTSAPNEQLHISATAADVRLQSTGTNQASRYILQTDDQEWRIGTHGSRGDNLWVYNGTSGNYRLDITPAGNVGIGTFTPDRLLHLYKSTGTTAIKIEAADTSQASVDLKNSDSWFRIITNDSALRFWDQSNNTERIRINSSGNVGIGTTSPSSRLHIDSTSDAMHFTRSGQETYRIIHGTSGLYFTRPDSSSLAFGVTQNSDFDIFNTSGSVMFRADASTGNVGVGTTSPGKKLTVEGQTQFYEYSGSHLTHDATSNYNFDTLVNHASATNGGGLQSYIKLTASATNSSLGQFNAIRTRAYAENTTVNVNGLINYYAEYRNFTSTSSVTLSHHYGLKVNSLGVGGNATVTNNYGVYLDPGTNATNNYGVFQAGGSVKNKFEGPVGINTNPAAGVELHVNGEIRVDSTNGVATRLIRSNYFSSSSDIEVRSGSSGDIILGDGTARLTLASDDTATFAGDVTVTGNLNITGDINTQTVNNLDVVDKLITLGKGQSEANSNGSGILVDGSNASLLWDESNNTWDFNKSLDVVGNIHASGNVGIGVSSPNVPLDVVGIIRTTTSFVGNASIVNQVTAGTSGGSIKFKNNSGSDRVIITDAGAVGINTNSPNEKLHVEGTSRFGGDMHFGSAVNGLVYRPVESGSAIDRFFLMFDETNNASFPFLTNRTPNGAVVIKTGTAGGAGENEHFRIKGGDGTVDAYFTNTNLGIGTSSPDVALHVESADETVARFERNAGSGFTAIDIKDGVGTSGNSAIRFSDTSGSPGEINYEHADNSLRINTNSSERMRITSAGKVGIGTTTPQRALEIRNGSGVGYGLISGTTGAELRFRPDNVYSTNGNFGIEVTGTSSSPYTTTMNFTGFHSNETTVLTLKGNQKVGIANANPTYTLDVRGPSAIDGTTLSIDNTYGESPKILQFTYNGNVPAAKVIGYGRNNTSTLPYFAIEVNDTTSSTASASTTERLRITSAGRVGIGTTTPSEPLDVVGTARMDNAIVESNLFAGDTVTHWGDGDTKLQFATNDIKLIAGGATHFHAASNQTTVLYSGNSTALTLDTSQNATFAGDVTVSGGDITVSNVITGVSGGTFRIKNSGGTTIAQFADGGTAYVTGNFGVGGNPGARFDVNSGATNTVAIFESTDNKAFIKIKDDDTDTHLISMDGHFSIGESSTDYDNFKVNITSGDTTIAGSITGKDSGIIIDSISGPYGRIHGTSSIFLGGSSTSLVQLSAALIPDGDSVRSLGNSNRYWSHGYIDAITTTGDVTVGGSVEIPGYITHTGDGDTKIGFNTDNSVEIRAGGNLQINADASRSYLRYQGSSKLYTDSAGVIIVGDILVNTTTSGGYVQVDYSDDSLKLADANKLKLGTGNDLQIFHDGSVSKVENYTGNLTIQQRADNSDIVFQCDDGSGGITDYIRLDGSTPTVVFSKSSIHTDNIKAYFGTGLDLEIYHDGSDSYIKDSGTGNLKIQGDNNVYIGTTGGEYYFRGIKDDAAVLYFNNSAKLTTTASGISVTNGITLGGTVQGRTIPFVIHTGWGDDTSTTANKIIPLGNSVTEQNISAADGQHFFVAPYNGKVQKIIMKNVAGTLSSSFSTELKLYINGTNVTSSGELTASSDAITWEPSSSNTFNPADEISLVYQKSATGKYWREVSLTMVLTMNGQDI